MSGHLHEIITISDSEEEVSLDLFNSTTDDDGSAGARPESDDVFSSDSDSEGCSRKDTDKKNSTSWNTHSSALGRSDNRSSKRSVGCDGDVQCSSSVINSLRKSHITSPTKDGNISNSVLIKKSLIVGDYVQSARKNGESNKCITKVKSDPWTSRHLNNIAKKLEERQQIMKEITRRHEKSFTIVPDIDLDLSEKKSKTSIIGCAVIRKKADRSRLQGVACAASKAYFDALELSPESKERRINKVSRVRVVAQRMPSTPENYWEVGFPSESEQRRRGLIKEVYFRNKNGRNLFH